MDKLIIFIGICLAFASGSKLPAPAGESEKHIGCYYLNEEQPNDPQDHLHVENFDASLCTHLYSDSIPINIDASVDAGFQKDYLDEFEKLKDSQKKKKHLKVSISLGGLPGTAENLIRISTVANLREKFSNNVVNVVKKHEFNGIEINMGDNDHLSKAEIAGLNSNKKNFVLLLKAIREKFDREGFILSLTVGATEAAAKLFDIRGVSKYVHFINLKAFDFHTSESPDDKVVHTAPMHFSSKENVQERKLNVDYAVRYWISKGVPPNKLILGIAFYTSGYTLANPKVFGRGSQFYGGSLLASSGIYTQAYYDVCPLTKKPEWKHIYDKEQQVPYIYNADQIIAYENVQSITKKIEYAKEMKLGGVFVWSIEQDDVGGKCGEKFLLLKTINRVLGHKC